MDSESLLSNILIGIVTSLIAGYIGLFLSKFFWPRIYPLLFKYLLFPVWACKQIADLRKNISSIQEEILVLSGELGKLNKNSSTSVDKSGQYVLPEGHELFLGLIWIRGPLENIGPYCQECYYKKEGHPTLHLQIQKYNNEKRSIYCPHPNHLNFVQHITNQDFENACKKFSTDFNHHNFIQKYYDADEDEYV